MLLQVCNAVIVSLAVMFCFCTLFLACAKAMILCWIGVVIPGEQVQMPLLRDEAVADSDEEDESGAAMFDKYRV